MPDEINSTDSGTIASSVVVCRDAGNKVEEVVTPVIAASVGTALPGGSAVENAPDRAEWFPEAECESLASQLAEVAGR